MKTYIIIVNYFCHSYTTECVRSIFKYVNLEFVKIIIVDNSNDDLEFTRLEDSLIKNINEQSVYEIINTKYNLGFAGGINFGLNYVREIELSSNFNVWILNPDTKIDENTLPELLKIFNSTIHSVVGSIIKDYNGDFIIASHGEFNPNLGLIVTKTNGKISGKYFYPIGASLFTTNSVLKNLGDFDPEYFLYYEELDFVLKGLKKDLIPIIAQNSFIYHSQGATTKNKSKSNKNLTMLEFQSKGLKKLYSKHFATLKHGLRIGLIIKSFKFFFKGQFKEAKIFFNQLYKK